ncbi:MAG: 4-hydroxybenzoate octaprenyltransferase [Gammaproteobacteria bacterium]|nr:4-hydroxybenzoate octaprenyltransferase [Gammaproteobacteria bacterium]
MRFDKPIGIYLLLWPTLWALWIAGEGHPDAKVFTVFVLGVIVMRAAGCVINDYADRKYDKRVERTKTRPLATGKVSPKEAIALFAALIAIAFILVLQMNELTIYLSFGGLFLAVLYPFMKRFTYLPQPVLGAAFGWAVPMAFAAQTGTLPDVAWLLFIATVLWATAYDTMYAMVDIKDDLKIGVRSTAILFGEQDRLIIGILQLTLLFNLIVIGKQSNFGTTYYLSCFLAAGLAVYQQYLIRHRDRERCFQAFLNNHWFGMIIFIGIVLHYAFNQKVISS